MNELKGKEVVVEFLNDKGSRFGILLSYDNEFVKLDTGRTEPESIFRASIKLVRLKD